VILDPINDVDCLGQITTIARELAPTTLIISVAKKLGSREAVIHWLQSLPQADDDGSEHVRYIQCDVPQRVRLLPDDPNCVERSMGALMLLEVLAPKTPRALATVDRPLRHTGLVEKHGAHWRAVDLFPRRNAPRNFDWSELGKDVLQGVHKYVGKPVLSFYGLGSAADTLGEQEDKLIGRDKKNQPEKKGSPPAGKAQPPKTEPAKPAAKPSGGKNDGGGFLASFIGAGASRGQTRPEAGGGPNGQEAKAKPRAGVAAVDGTAGRASQAGDRDGGHPHDQGEEAQRWWRILGR
jgi:hypothetical protein